MYIQFPFTLKQFLILKIVITKQNFTEAANFLYISQPAISKQLKKLEKDCDMIFLKFKNKNLVLTKKGQIVFQYIERILYICEESYRILKELKIGDREGFKLGVTYDIANYLIPKLILILTKTYPRLNIQIHVSSSLKILEDLSKNKINIALTENLKTIKKDLICSSFVKDELVLISSKLGFLSKEKKVSKLDLYEMDFVCLKSNFRTQKLVENLLIKNEIKIENLKTVAQVSSLEAIKNAVSLGLGVAFIPSLTIEKELKLKIISIVQIRHIKIYRKLNIVKNTSKISLNSIKILQYELNHLIDKINK